MNRTLCLVAASLCLTLTACDEDPVTTATPDAADTSTSDVQTLAPDANIPGPDANIPEPDATEPTPDAGPPTSDTTEEDGANTLSPCEACLASGGTWQPEANACTMNCDIQDISCYTTTCPEPCSAASCGTCFGQEDCEAAGCTWNQSGPAMWCN